MGSFGGIMSTFKVLPYNKPAELEKLLAEGYMVNGVFSHTSKAILILKK